MNRKSFRNFRRVLNIIWLRQQFEMTKTLRKAIMKRSKLRNKFNKEKNIENWSEYKRQRKRNAKSPKNVILIISM